MSKKIDIVYIQNLTKKAELYSAYYKPEDCLMNVVEFKKVSCTLQTASILKHEREMIADERHEFKVLDEPVLYGATIWVLEPGSP